MNTRITSHSTKLRNEVYISVKKIQTLLLDYDVRANMNDVIQGCVQFTLSKGIVIHDLKYFVTTDNKPPKK